MAAAASTARSIASLFIGVDIVHGGAEVLHAGSKITGTPPAVNLFNDGIMKDVAIGKVKNDPEEFQAFKLFIGVGNEY